MSLKEVEHKFFLYIITKSPPPPHHLKISHFFKNKDFSINLRLTILTIFCFKFHLTMHMVIVLTKKHRATKLRFGEGQKEIVT